MVYRSQQKALVETLDLRRAFARLSVRSMGPEDLTQAARRNDVYGEAARREILTVAARKSYAELQSWVARFWALGF